MKINLTFKKVCPDTYLYIFDKRYEMCMAFVRLVEFDETIKGFKSKYFDLETIMQWYAETYGEGAFTYPVDWHGFTVAGDSFLIWHSKFRHSLRPIEKKVFSHILKMKRKDIKESHFIVACRGYGLRSTIHHELAHAMYEQDFNYQHEMNRLVVAMPDIERQIMVQRFIHAGYPKSIWQDEIQAYLGTSGSQCVPTTNITCKKCFEDIFNKYFEKLIKDQRKLYK